MLMTEKKQQYISGFSVSIRITKTPLLDFLDYQNTDYKNSTSKVIKIIFACVNIHFLV